MAVSDRIASCSPCTVTRHDDHIELDFSQGTVFQMAGSTLLRSGVLAELEATEGGNTSLCQQHVCSWLHFIRRGQSISTYGDLHIQTDYFHVDQLVEVLIVRALCWLCKIAQ